MVVGVGLLPVALATPASAAPVGQGFTLNAGDLNFILKQIKIAEQHAATATPADPCGTLRGPGPNQIPAEVNGDTLPWGLRTVDGTCNNLIAGQENFGAANVVFPRRVPGVFEDADPVAFDVDGPGGQAVDDPTSYTQTKGSVFDSEPRTVSNLIVDQTAGNPAAVAAAGEGAVPDALGNLPIPNVATDVGLSAPFNSLFTLFGQFFDHGLDLVSKSGGTVFIPLQPDDPLYIEGGRSNFMVLTRSTNQPGPDGVVGDDPSTPQDESADDVKEAKNTTTPFVDQNQTYTSHPSHQVFVRQYQLDVAGDPVSTGALITGPDGGMGTWASVKEQAANLLGIRLSDGDVLNVPLLATDPYGRFIPGVNGFPQLVTGSGLVEGNPAGGGVAVPADVIRTGHAFLDDIAHNAVPKPGFTADPDTVITPTLNPCQSPGQPNCVTEYDDEMLNVHFIGGDGRVNENIGLTAIHHVFHAEHNRLNDDIKNLIGVQPAATIAEWQVSPGVWNGERLFQAARFVTEMEYQHLVFEEFGRKVQPLVNLFGEGGTGYRTDVDPAIKAEFAHAVYRFGHSMLNEVVARTNPDGTNNDIGLIPAFLNPPEFTDNGAYTPEQAAGSIVRGMSRQVGNEIDEFVTEALRNNLLGLPLDLATINMARARETGTPSLNNARKQFHAETANAALAPYTSWADFSFNLKHRESLVNFVAAYGLHPSVTGASTMAAKRTAAELLIANDPDGVSPTPENPEGTPPSPADSDEFMNSTGAWANGPGGASITGVDDIDLWAGGLAEKRMVFGGLLGSTFNYVFELQLEDLQFGDRFYYLSRTAGLNLLTQLEGNSFTELVTRNTDASGLPADVFSRPDYIFNVGALGTSGAILDDPATEYDEADRTTEPGRDLLRQADGTIRYIGPAHVVFNGTADNDKMWSSEGDDTLRGNEGNDRIEGGDGADNIIGGDGDDILTDLFGDDVIKGGNGNDAISSGQGFGGDLNQGGLGNDFIIGGNDATETFAGPGNDFVYAGDGEDTVFGDDGDDWIEGGAGPFNLLQGDFGNPFADDPDGGHDVLDGDGGEQDFDAEGGDDIMLMGPGIQRSEGMLGFDWATHKGDPQVADSDMSFTGLLPPSVDVLRDRFDLVEALSGWDKDDVLRGDSRIAGPEGENPEGTITPSHSLTADGIARINGLQDLLGAGVTGYSTGNIILGGAGSDVIEGRGGDDRIDGDKWLNVRISVVDAAGVEIQTVDSVRDLQQAVFAGAINPGQLRIVREILPTDPGVHVDAALFSGPRADYDISIAPDGSVTVAHVRGTATDGTDRLTGVEELRFTDGVVSAIPNSPATGQPVVVFGTNTTLTPNVERLSPQEGIALAPVDTSGISDVDGLGTFSYQWLQRGAGSALPFGDIAGATAPTFTPTQAEVGRELAVRVSFVDGRGNPEAVTSAGTVVGDLFLGTTNADAFAGNAGEDLARGGSGNDNIGTVAGNDVVSGDAGDDVINTGSGNDVVQFTGSQGFDNVNGAAGVDRIEARANNTVIGLSAFGGIEEFTAGPFTGVSILGSAAGNSFNFNTVALTNIARVDGGGGNDVLSMPDTPNVVLGGAGADTILGRGGDDVITGGAGNDVLNGGTGLDQFVYQTSFGADRIQGFDTFASNGQDLIDLRAVGVTAANFSSRVVIGPSSTPAGSTLVTVRVPGFLGIGLVTTGTITLEGVAPSNVNASDFILG